MRFANRALLVTLIAAAVVATGLVGYTGFRLLVHGDPRQGGTFGEARIGGPFALVDGDGRPVTDAAFRGRLMLVYFGYTFCPDVCPTELSTMSAALDQLGDRASEVVPIFITIDPERDTPAQMKTYVSNFRPGLVGLTGTSQQIAGAARAYRVYYRKAEDTGATQYTMDHSSIVYLMGRDGHFLTHFAGQTSPDDMARTIRNFL